MLLLAAAAPRAPATAQQEWIDALESEGVESARACPVSRLNLEAGHATLRIRDGIVVPATAVGGRVRELVFLGHAVFELEPPDAIEESQLELFTGLRSLSVEVTEAILVANSEAVAEALLRRPPAPGTDPAQLDRARELFADWRDGGERDSIQVEQKLLADLAGDSVAATYFAGRFETEDLGQFLYIYDPADFEPISLGQFVSWEGTDRERRRLERRVGKAQRKGRLLGLDVDKLGSWDSWISAPLRTEDGQVLHGGSGFESRHVEIDASIAPGSLDFEATAAITLRAVAPGRTVVPLWLLPDLVLRKVTDGSGSELFFHRGRERVLVLLSEAAASGEEVTLRFEYGGSLLDEVGRSMALRSTTGWYPQLEELDRTTFDVTLHWPKRLELVGAGRVVASGEEGPLRWQRRRLDRPAYSFSFQVGRFDLRSTMAGETRIVLAIDPEARWLVDDADAILEVARDALEYFETIFGPYPYEQLTIATVPTFFSEAAPGFVILNELAAMRAGREADWEDNATVAHEIAHQWWGHEVGWRSYRDQWISEAMANYSALLFVRNRRSGNRQGPTAGWQYRLLERTPDGRPIESLGPVVLGVRLDSSRAYWAYFPIVYQKGAVVINTLARAFGEETFVKVLASLLRGTSGGSLSTEEFFESIEQITGASLGDFTRQFIYGTGLPHVYYDVQFARLEDGTWQVTGEAEQRPPYRYEYRVVRHQNGRLDVGRERVEQSEVAGSALVVPVQIVYYDPDKTASEGEAARSAEPKENGNAVLEFPIVLEGDRTAIDFRVRNEPKQVWLDARSEVFGLFYNRHHLPKRMLYREGVKQSDAGSWEDAEATLAKALAAPVEVGPGFGRERSERQIEADGAELDAWIWMQMARNYLDRGQAQDATRALDRARDEWKRMQRRAYAGSNDPWPAAGRILDARLAMQKLNPQEAWDILYRPVVKQRRWRSREALLTLALAAHGLGREAVYDELVEEAEELGADLSLLEGED